MLLVSVCAGAELGITSDGFFELEDLPKSVTGTLGLAIGSICVCSYVTRKTTVIGAGYIAVELAGILNALGSDVSLVIRRDKVSKYLQ